MNVYRRSMCAAGWAAWLAAASVVAAEGAGANPDASLEALAESVAKADGGSGGRKPSAADKLEGSLRELSEIRAKIADEKIPLAKKITALENEQIDARKEYEAVRRQLDTRNLDMNNLRNETKSREQENSYLASLLGEYIRNFESRLHMVELGRYRDIMESARLAADNSGLSAGEMFARQMELVNGSLRRLEDLAGGTRFEGRAAGGDGLVKQGSFVLLGPVAYFASGDGKLAGVAEQRVGSAEPAVEGYEQPGYADLTRTLVSQGGGTVPFDASLGNARKIEETKETLREHILAGGPVMAPILGLAGLVALVALFKWLALAFVFPPRARRLKELYDAVAGGRKDDARVAAARLRGPYGAVLRAGAAHLDDPKELIEEIMFEKMLGWKQRFNRFIPFVAVGAASAPLLGLLGTVTGIINTFKMITVFGSGDVKMLSAGISEALITTEFGLYVAIPCLLLHAFLSRKAKALLDRMERMSIDFLSQVTRMKEVRKAA